MKMINILNGETDGSGNNGLPDEAQTNSPVALNEELIADASNSNQKNMVESISRMDTKKKNKRKETIGWIVSLATAVVLALLLRFFVFEFILVDGPSMEPTLWTNEVVLVEKVSYKFSPPERFNIIVCFSPDNVILVKRVIGLPGDKLEIKNGQLYINDKMTEEKYLIEPMDSDMEPVTVPENSVFVMGDHRNVSNDSRDVGPIPFKNILGHAVFIVWPFDRIVPLSGK